MRKGETHGTFCHLQKEKERDPAVRKRYAKRRQAMMDKLKIPLKTHQCFIGNLEPDNKDGCYPDWSRARAGRQVDKFKRPTRHQASGRKGGEAHGEAQRCCAALVSKWAPYENSDRTARRYASEQELLERPPRNGTAASDRRLLLGNRKTRTGKKHEFRLQELQEQVKASERHCGTETCHETP